MKKQIIGIVVSTTMQKTVVIRTELKYRHPIYLKVITKHKKFKAHNELKDVSIGDKVVIEETRPISKDKHFRVISKVVLNTK